MTERYICTKEEPWTKEKGRSAHPDAVFLYDEYNGLSGGDYERYECPNCKLRFWVTLAD